MFLQGAAEEQHEEQHVGRVNKMYSWLLLLRVDETEKFTRRLSRRYFIKRRGRQWGMTDQSADRDFELFPGTRTLSHSQKQSFLFSFTVHFIDFPTFGCRALNTERNLPGAIGLKLAAQLRPGE